MADLAAAQKELASAIQQLETTKASLEEVTDEKQRGDLNRLISDLEELIPLLEYDLSTMQPATVTPAIITPPAPVEPQKWSVENHPAYQNRNTGQAAAATEAPVVHRFQVKDKIMAMYKRQFAPASIIQITGSQANPKYYVKYEGYSEFATLDSDQIKSIENKKRKADHVSTPSNSSVISAAANINHTLANQVKHEPSKVSDGPIRPAKIPKKIKQQKQLEEGKNKWKAFTAGKAGKASTKQSMFRTGEGVTARVGFTGSGQTMRKDAPRTKHVYQPGESEEY
ncbi:hypothetical protein EJ08DRAFT_672574 [Tothia fuscella]|uniref:Tudor domain-containing protein n=1 Tax=Tothia fuscella TaxID=1048955 RepID=A0A9P4NIP1_9PEZI|nr:hypothetical protein EJ08DRAFT_672574 [Tothia fuscella]